MARLLTKIKEFSTLADNASKLGYKELKLDRDMYIGLLSEINYILATKIENTSTVVEQPNLNSLSGGNFK